jgi:hypothetical protein
MPYSEDYRDNYMTALEAGPFEIMSVCSVGDCGELASEKSAKHTPRCIRHHLANRRVSIEKDVYYFLYRVKVPREFSYSHKAEIDWANMKAAEARIGWRPRWEYGPEEEAICKELDHRDELHLIERRKELGI